MGRVLPAMLVCVLTGCHWILPLDAPVDQGGQPSLDGPSVALDGPTTVFTDADPPKGIHTTQCSSLATGVGAVTVSFEVEASGQLLTVGVGFSTVTDPPTVTVSCDNCPPVTASLLLGETASVTNGPTAQIWYLTNPPPGPNTATAQTMPPLEVAVWACVWSGVDMGLPIGPFPLKTAGASGVAIDYNVPAPLDHVVLDAVTWQLPSAPGPGPLQTLLVAGPVQGSWVAASSRNTVPIATPMSWSSPSGAKGEYSVATVVLTPKL